MPACAEATEGSVSESSVEADRRGRKLGRAGICGRAVEFAMVRDGLRGLGSRGTSGWGVTVWGVREHVLGSMLGRVVTGGGGWGWIRLTERCDRPSRFGRQGFDFGVQGFALDVLRIMVVYHGDVGHILVRHDRCGLRDPIYLPIAGIWRRGIARKIESFQRLDASVG